MGTRYRVTHKNALTMLVIVGLVLRVWQYAANPSQWYDEISIARNITGRPFGDLVSGPLWFTQVAPVGFIAAVKVVSLVLGASDYALRLVPFLCGIIALLLFRRLAEQTLEGAAAVLAMALFAFAPPLIRYTTEIKQYGPDVMVAIALTLVALDLRRPIAAGLLGFLVIWFSQSSVFVMAGLGGALLLIRRRQAVPTVALWAVASVISLVVTRRYYTTPETIAYMHGFWGVRHGFLPLPPRPASAVGWTWSRLTQFFDEPWMLDYPWPILYAILVLFGLAMLWRRHRDTALLLTGPVAVTFMAAVAQQYPFEQRVVLFLLPAVVLTLAYGIASFRQPVIIGALLLGPLVAIIRTPPPYVIEAYKPVFAFFRDHRQAADQVYVFTNTFSAAEYYGPRYGLPEGSFHLGICDRQDNRHYLTDLDRYRGTPRLWVLSSGVPPYAMARRTIGRYLGTIGVRTDSLIIPSWTLGPVSAELYNLSDSTRLAAAQAATFTVDVNPDTLRPACRNVRRPTSPAGTSR